MSTVIKHVQPSMADPRERGLRGPQACRMGSDVDGPGVR